jgi:hypothetical protein
MQLMPDSPLRRAAREAEDHVASLGWDQGPRLFALVPTAQLAAAEPALAEQLAEQLADDPEGLSLIEQELPAGRELEQLLGEVAWPASVQGCAAVIERIMLPPEAEAELPSDPAAAAAAAANHPSRQEVRLTGAVLRNGQAHSMVRAKQPDAELLEGPDLVPALIEQLRTTLT